MATQTDGGHRRGLSAFGLGLLTDMAPPGAWRARPQGEPMLYMCTATAGAIAETWSGSEAVAWEGFVDGAPFVVERGRAGDYRFVHGAESDGGEGADGIRAVHHLSPDLRVLRCAPGDWTEPSWWRVVLDSVLFTIALLHGYEALHSGAVATPEGVIAVAARSGGGKSTLLSELLRQGLTLMADDVLVLEPTGADAAPLAHPAPPLMTVSAARLQALGEGCMVADANGPASSPETICALGEECWIAAPVHPRPLPLTALVVLNRAPGLPTCMRRAERPLSALMDSLLRFPRTRDRERARFELAGAIAAHVPVWELEADPSVEPGALAGLLLRELVAPDRTQTWVRSLSAVG